ncbi:Nramp family divalent metal transporter [Streptomyces naphthomycinicus]|uniref:Nramp family divalent metal transporter n=1 Tax=Streptomyces naphthomycinicus TaxID=2872625 RepID=UPI003B75CA3F
MLPPRVGPFMSPLNSPTELASFDSDQRGSPAGRGLITLGPAFVAASAYVDPGNFATNMSAGSAYGYQLLWVIVAASLTAVVVQAAAARLGLATGRDLARLCRENTSRRTATGLWIQAELVIVATELAEVIGGAVALAVLFGIPLVVGGAITGAVAFVVLALETRGLRRFELAVAGLFAVILCGFLYALVVAGPDAGSVAAGLKPGFAGPDSLLLATGIVGATVMPHAVYLHSGLTAQHVGQWTARTGSSRLALLRGQRADIGIALGLAALVNVSMLIVAAEMPGRHPLDSLFDFHTAMRAEAGGAVATVFALALLASGLAATSVGTYTGQTVMAGFLRRSLPRSLRRALTLLPALGILATGLSPTTALVWSQVILSFGIPFALVPLLWLTSRRDLMGDLVNSRATSAALAGITVVISSLNFVLLWHLFA